MQNLPVGTVVVRGTLVECDHDTLQANICKTTEVLAGGTTQKPRVAKGHYFVAGDKVSKVGGGEATISSIDTENPDYDVLNLSAAITGATAGAQLVESGTTAGQAKFTPNEVVGSDLVIDGKGVDVLDIAYEAMVLYKHLPFPVLDAWKVEGGVCLKSNPNIMFINQ